MISQVLEQCDLASAAILEVYRSGDFDVSLKDDRSPVTRADLEASAILVRGLAKISGLPVVSEEKTLPFVERRTFKRFWLVDPLDGTKDFLERDDEFTVNVALIDAGEPVLGVVAVPALGVAYFAEAGSGAHRRDAEGVTPIRYSVSGRAEQVCADSRFHSSPKIEEFCRANKIQKILRSGSAIKMCKLAEGVVDVYPRFGPTMEWDVAASHVIAREAGCQVLDLETRRELTYNKEDMRNPGFIAFPKGADFRW